MSLILSVDDVTPPLRNGMRKVGMTSIPDGRSVKLPWHTISWARGGDCEPWAEVDIRMELSAYGGTAWLRYDVDHYSQRTGPQE